MAAGTGPRPDTTTLLPLAEYDLAIVCFSGGKDSLASYFALLDAGFPPDRIEFWHQRVDGAEPGIFDWPCTDGYVRTVASRLRVPLRFQWRHGGIEREMLRDNSPTAPIAFEGRDGELHYVGGRGSRGTRLKFPQVSADLKVRWCSAYAKIDVCDSAIANDPTLKSSKILLISGERREESSNRARYPERERHRRTNALRRVDRWRIVIDWPETRVWERIRQSGIRPHVAYELGYGRLSCQHCIFADAWQAAMNRKLDPVVFGILADYEVDFGLTIKRNISLPMLADKAEVPDPDPVLAAVAMSDDAEYGLPVFVGDAWRMPAGAFKHSGGPT